MELHHPLLIEFSEHRDLIIELKNKDADFRNHAQEYHDVDRKICLIEREFETATEAEIEQLKKRRLWLKDRLYHQILEEAGIAA